MVRDMRLQSGTRKACMNCSAAACCALPALAAAQEFPTKPIKLIVPFPPGGPNDIIARVVGQRMSELIKQPVVIDNRGGQGGVLGTDAVAKAAPDGYTIGIVSASALVINPSMEKVAYDVAEGFRAGHAGGDRAGNAGGREQRARQEHGRAGRARQGAARQAQFRLRRRRRPAASCRRIVQAHRQDRHRARALSRRGARDQRSARPAGADGVPRPAGDAAADQGRHAAADRARRAAARADRARRADHRGSRHAGSADRELVRHDRAGGHAARRSSPRSTASPTRRWPIRRSKEKLADQGLTGRRRHAGAVSRLSSPPRPRNGRR